MARHSRATWKQTRSSSNNNRSIFVVVLILFCSFAFDTKHLNVNMMCFNIIFILSIQCGMSGPFPTESHPNVVRHVGSMLKIDSIRSTIPLFILSFPPPFTFVLEVFATPHYIIICSGCNLSKFARIPPITVELCD